ncbi:hypothetical protein EG329_007208 [Mollisiaceae sp. DMI_Dod_QoI]|nr:hypothetical protein EG329_007208 [Helotiales sp. DMI_Dod_QoI]
MKLFPSKSGRLRRVEAEAIAPIPAENHKFDEQTGQVYTEITISVPKAEDRDWPHQLRPVRDLADYELPPESDDIVGRATRARDVIRVLERSNHVLEQTRLALLASVRAPGEIGARSLVGVAIETILRNIADLTVDVLETLPIQLTRRVWEEIKKRQMLSLHSWQVFSTVLRQEDDTLRLRRYRQQINEPKSPLHIYVDPLTSKSFEFLTFLSITTVFAVPELVKLSKLKNLCALEIVNEEGPTHRGVSDRIIRAWSIAAGSEGAFQVLRILKLWKHAEVTNVSLGYLNLFPALAFYDVTGCSFDLQASAHARNLGWKSTVDPNVLGQFEAACVERAALMRVTLGKEPRAVRKVFAQQLSEDAFVSLLPRVEIPGYLTRDEATVRHQPLVKCEDLERHATGLDLLQNKLGPSAHVTEQQFDILQKDFLLSSRPFETWDFPVYTGICKIGELRNDSDLARAGIQIGDQPIVENELICPLPIVSLRIGPTPPCLRFKLDDAVYKSFYESTNPSTESFERFTHQSKHNGRMQEAIKAKRLAFTKIKATSTNILSTSQKVQEMSSMEGQLKRPSSSASRPTSSGGAAPAKRRSIGLERKRKSLADMLGSFFS